MWRSLQKFTELFIAKVSSGIQLRFFLLVVLVGCVGVVVCIIIQNYDYPQEFEVVGITASYVWLLYINQVMKVYGLLLFRI